ncbi:MAG TPA: CHAT domain-containing protein [Candidatus Sulfomarinibacteraceae bacterium]|nr:CHAT domain-containing protein [Candidatus Sulfomarinibacteraceae bacterium]
MTRLDRASVVPDEAARLLASGDEEAAGERVREYAERLARTAPGDARVWAESASSTCSGPPLLRAFLRWAAGVGFHLAGEPSRAERELTAAVQAMIDCGRPDLADRVGLLLVDVFAERLELGRARRLARRLERRFTVRGDAERSAVALANLACAEDAADRVDRARSLWQRAAGRLPPGGFRHLLARANLANAAALAGRFDESMAEHRAVADAAAGLGLEALARQAEANLAEVEFAVGRVAAAFDRWQRVIESSRAAGDRASALATEVDLATAETELGELELARGRLLRVLGDLDRAGLRHDRARALRLLTVVDAAEGRTADWDGAVAGLAGDDLRLQRDLLAVERAQLDPTADPDGTARAARRLVAAGLRHRGRLGLAWAAERALKRGDRRSAERWARQAMAGAGVSAWVRLLAHHVLGRIGGPSGTRHLFRAVHWADRLHGRLTATSDRSAFLRLRGGVYLDLMAALLDRGTARDRRRALDLLTRFRSGWLLDELARRADRGDDPEVRRWQELRARLASLLSRVEGLEEPRVRRFGVRIHREIRGVEDQLRETEVALARRWPTLVPDVAGRPVSELLLARLPADQIFVEYFLDDRDLVIFLADGGRLRVERVRGAAPEIRSLAASVRFHMDTATWRQQASNGTAAGALEHRLRRLGEILLRSVPSRAWRSLWIAPHAELYHLPWAAVELPDGGALVDRAVFSLVPGAGAVTGLLRDEPVRPERIAFGAAAAEDLPLIAEEVRQLAGLVKSSAVVEATTRQAFLAMLGGYDAVHLAGHAVFLDGMPSASGLRLSDGYVTVHDLAAIRLAPTLVSFGVCSGVRTGDNLVDHRYDGFLRALLAGGVRSVVGAISPVRDDVAFAFDLELYRALDRLGDPGNAYRCAVEAVRREHPSPAVWGNFHFFGDHRSWSLS